MLDIEIQFGNVQPFKYRFTAPGSGLLNWLHFSDRESDRKQGKTSSDASACVIYRSVDDTDLQICYPRFPEGVRPKICRQASDLFGDSQFAAVLYR